MVHFVMVQVVAVVGDSEAGVVDLDLMGLPTLPSEVG